MSVEVTAVRGGRDLRAFIDLPYRLNANHPLWVPPLKLERRLFLSRRMTAFFTPGVARSLRSTLRAQLPQVMPFTGRFRVWIAILYMMLL